MYAGCEDKVKKDTRILTGNKYTKTTETNSEISSSETKSNYYPKRIKPCVEESILPGVTEDSHYRKWKFSKRWEAAKILISEWKRLGYDKEKTKSMVLDWNRLNKPPLTPKQVEENLLPLVDWVFKREFEYGCKKKLLELRVCFIKERRCLYYEEYSRNKAKSLSIYPDEDFDKNGWPGYLRKNYEYGLLAEVIYREMRTFASDKGVPQDGIVFIGFEYLARRITIEYKDIFPTAMTVCRAMKVLEEVGLLRKVSKGCFGGKGLRRANGYQRIMPIPNPQPEAIDEDSTNLLQQVKGVKKEVLYT